MNYSIEWNNKVSMNALISSHIWELQLIKLKSCISNFKIYIISIKNIQY